jgi:predicted RNase H-like nuclease (RuvC/YqgF family)
MHATIDDYEIKALRYQDELQKRDIIILDLEAKVAGLNRKLEQRGRERTESSTAIRTVFRDQSRLLSQLRQENEKLEGALQSQNEGWEEVTRIFNELEQGFDALCNDS